MMGRVHGSATSWHRRSAATVVDAGRRAGTVIASRAEYLALALALAPIVVAVVRAIVVEWTPVGDAAYFTIRSRDVLTADHPFLGAWSSSSRTLGDDINNLGPLQLDLLAPFTKLDPYWGTAMGVGVTNALAVMGVWFAARRMFSSKVAVVGAMAATLALEATIGSLQLIEARQQFAMLMPFWLLLWLAAWMMTGDWWSLAPTVAAASLLLQTHFTYAYHVATLVITGLVGFAVATFRARQDRRLQIPVRPVATAAAIAVVVWAQPLWDQVARTGNLRQALTEASNSGGAPGFEYGARSVATATLTPPFWTPRTMDDFLRTPLDISAGAAWTAILAWAAALVAVVVVSRRRTPVMALAIVGLVALGSAVYTTAKIPPTLAAVVPANYMWNWPIGVLLTTVVVAGAWLGLRDFLHARAERGATPTTGTATTPATSGTAAPIATTAAVVCAVVACIPALDTSEGFAEYAAEDGMGRRTARPLVEQLSDGLAEHDVDGPVLIDRSRQDPLSYLNYTFLAELQRHRIDFQFRPGETDLRRFGQRRCADGTATHRLLFATGRDRVEQRPGEVTLARVDAMSDDDLDELADLDARFGDLLRDGAIEVKLDAIKGLGYQRSPELEEVLRDPGRRPSLAVAHYLSTMSRYGVVVVPDELKDEFDRWLELSTREVQDRTAILLAPITDADRRNICTD